MPDKASILPTSDPADVDYMVEFKLSQVGVAAEFNTHARSKLNLLVDPFLVWDRLPGRQFIATERELGHHYRR